MTQKIGAGHVKAMGRQGLRELRGALYPQSNIAQPTEYGVFGTQTPGEVAESRRDDGKEMEEEARTGSVLADRIEQIQARDVRGRDERSPDMER